MRSNIVLDFDAFLTEGFYSPSASTYNTPGIGNVTANFTDSIFVSEDEESVDQDKSRKHIEPTFEGDDSWMKPNGDYSNRQWLVKNYEMYKNEKQSMTRFQIGYPVRCVNNEHECFGMTGKIIAFEDNTIRWEVQHSETGVGITAKQYRCQAQDLEIV
jgi:hypothetical protein